MLHQTERTAVDNFAAEEDIVQQLRKKSKDATANTTLVATSNAKLAKLPHRFTNVANQKIEVVLYRIINQAPSIFFNL